MSDSQFLKHVPCPKCGSSDAGALYDDGHMHCFACSETIQEYDEDLADSGGIVEKTSKVVYTIGMDKDVEYKAIPERGITRATCEKYGVYANEQIHYYPYFNKEGKEVARKARAVETKSFTAHGNIKEATLFGQQLFHAGGKYVTVTEGELDALAAFQMTGSQWPVVSIKNGAASAKKDCQASFEWLDSFEAIVICFDNDEPGKKAAQEVAELFGPKAKIVKHKPEFKDACDYLKAGATKEYVNAWWRAEAYKPDGLMNGNELWEELRKPQQKPDAHWPYATLDQMLGGLRKRELVTIAAGTGQGKSTFLRQLIHHLLATTDDNIGMAFLEESPQRTALGLMSIEAQKALHLPDTVYSEEELKAAYDKTLGTGRCVLFNHFGSLDIDNVLSRLRFMAKGMNCRWLILDHYQMILSGMDTDERKGLDMLLTKLRTFVEETGVGLFGVSHTRRIDGNKGLENGAEITLSSLRGTQGISQLSDAVVGLQRDQQNSDPKVRNTTEVRLLKSRYTGETGPAGYLYFNRDTQRLEEIQMDVVEAL
jgi:twinkle protein